MSELTSIEPNYEMSGGPGAIRVWLTEEQQKQYDADLAEEIRKNEEDKAFGGLPAHTIAAVESVDRKWMEHYVNEHGTNNGVVFKTVHYNYDATTSEKIKGIKIGAAAAGGGIEEMCSNGVDKVEDLSIRAAPGDARIANRTAEAIENKTNEIVNSLELNTQYEHTGPNCYPQCSDASIVENLEKLLPYAHIVMFQPDYPATAVWKGIKDLFEKVKSIGEDAEKSSTEGGVNGPASLAGLTIEKSEMSELGWYSWMPVDMSSVYSASVPILSSPQIKIKQGDGFTSEQSIFQMMQSFTSGGIMKAVLDAFNATDFVKGGIKSAETVLGLYGISPRISPYFSLSSNQQFNSKPSISFETKLINDSDSAYNANRTFLNKIMIDSLIGMGADKRRWGSWLPPKLFHVTIKCGGKSIRTYSFCKLSVSVSLEGNMRKGGIPDAYDVHCDFESVLPETHETWGANGF